MSDLVGISEVDRRKMMHAIGNELNAAKQYRNYFAAHRQGDDCAIWASLVERGLAEQWIHNPPLAEDLVYFSVSEAGIAALKRGGDE